MNLSLYIAKGGVWKSTLATNLAAGCARAGLVTVIVEGDGQGSASQYVGLQPHDYFYHWIVDQAPLNDVIRPVPEAFHGHGELHIISAARGQRLIEGNPDSPAVIYQRLHELSTVADIVIVDTSPGRTHVHAGVLYGSDYILIPTTCDFLSRESFELTLDDYDRAADASERIGYPIAQILGAIPNRFVAREDVQQANYTILKETYGSAFPVFDMIRDLTVWRQAAEANMSIYEYRHDPDATDYAKRQARMAARELQPVLEAVLFAAGVTPAQDGAQ